MRRELGCIVLGRRKVVGSRRRNITLRRKRRGLFDFGILRGLLGNIICRSDIISIIIIIIIRAIRIRGRRRRCGSDEILNG